MHICTNLDSAQQLKTAFTGIQDVLGALYKCLQLTNKLMNKLMSSTVLSATVLWKTVPSWWANIDKTHSNSHNLQLGLRNTSAP